MIFIIKFYGIFGALHIQPTTHDRSAVSASAASLDMLAAAAAASDPPASTPPAE